MAEEHTYPLGHGRRLVFSALVEDGRLLGYDLRVAMLDDGQWVYPVVPDSGGSHLPLTVAELTELIRAVEQLATAPMHCPLCRAVIGMAELDDAYVAIYCQAHRPGGGARIVAPAPKIIDGIWTDEEPSRCSNCRAQKESVRQWQATNLSGSRGYEVCSSCGHNGEVKEEA